MNLLFALIDLPENKLENESGLYIDLAKECVARGHDVTLIGSSLIGTRLSYEAGMAILRVKSRRIVGEPNRIKKGIAMAMLPTFYKRAFNKYLKDKEFDWIVLPTPPVTLMDFVSKIKNETKSNLYLILRDIHPQSSWSLGEIPYKWMYNYLDKRSRKAYELADIIGCMSQKNIDYILEEYPNILHNKMSVLLNWMQPPKNVGEMSNIREKFSLENKVVALFGGNISLGQRIENIADLAYHYKDNQDVRFVVIGKGIKKAELIRIVKERGLTNVVFLDFMPQNDYLNFVKSVDIGLISIHEDNAAPTCPSKLASYMSLKIPVLAMINRNNDYGQMIDSAGAGFWAVGSDKKSVYAGFDRLLHNPSLRREMGENGYKFFLNNMTTEIACDTMLSQMNAIK